MRGHDEYVADRAARRRQKTNGIVALAMVVWPRLRSTERGRGHGVTEHFGMVHGGFFARNRIARSRKRARVVYMDCNDLIAPSEDRALEVRKRFQLLWLHSRVARSYH